jgi:hypothetical protein
MFLQVAANLRNLPLLVSVMVMLRQLLTNPFVIAMLRDPAASSSSSSSSMQVGGEAPPLQLLVPTVLTCVLGKRLCGGGGSGGGGGGGGGRNHGSMEEDHWSLRDMTASILADICNGYRFWFGVDIGLYLTPCCCFAISLF